MPIDAAGRKLVPKGLALTGSRQQQGKFCLLDPPSLRVGGQLEKKLAKALKLS